MVISKSEYMMSLKHPAWLWLKKYDKAKLPEPDANLQARFDDGNLFESYVEKLFPDAVKLGYKTGGDFDGNKYNYLPELTKKEIKKGTSVILQGRLEVDSLTSIFDVLERVGENTFDLYEIKSSTSVKPEYIEDLAFQTIVLEKSGLKIRNLYVIHVNNEYVRQGDIDPKKLASEKKDVTEDVRAGIDETGSNIRKAVEVVLMKKMPDVSPRYLNQGSMEEWLEVFRLVKGDLHKDSIYNLCGLTAKKAGQLEDAGIELMSDIPDDFDLTERQKRQVLAVKNGRQIDREEIKNFVGELTYPLHFFDYETFSGVIPAFDGIRPYQQVPFQYSLHILGKDGKLTHKEYLHTENSNPVSSLVKQMHEDFEGKGSVIVWHDLFEKARNKELAEMLPEYKAFLLDLNDRMVDLKIPFSKGWFIDGDFLGSASLKYVAPVLVEKPSYSEIEIRDGGSAQRIWMETILEGKNKEKRDEVIKNLRKYCTLDTFIMIEVLEKIK